MVELAITSFPCFALSLLETNRNPSYTVETLRLLAAPNRSLYLLLGKGEMGRLKTWHDFETLSTLATFVEGNRSGTGRASFGKTYRIPMMDVSSSVVRDRLEKRLCCNHLLSEKVLDYIMRHRLYCTR